MRPTPTKYATDHHMLRFHVGFPSRVAPPPATPIPPITAAALAARPMTITSAALAPRNSPTTKKYPILNQTSQVLHRSPCPKPTYENTTMTMRVIRPPIRRPKNAEMTPNPSRSGIDNFNGPTTRLANCSSASGTVFARHRTACARLSSTTAVRVMASAEWCQQSPGVHPPRKPDSLLAAFARAALPNVVAPQTQAETDGGRRIEFLQTEQTVKSTQIPPVVERIR